MFNVFIINCFLQDWHQSATTEIIFKNTFQQRLRVALFINCEERYNHVLVYIKHKDGDL